MSTETPVLDTIADITTASIEHNSVSPRDFMLARLAALIAVDAPPASYLANASAVVQAGLTAEDIEGVMIAVAPIVGTPRVMSAAGRFSGRSVSRSPWVTPRWASKPAYSTCPRGLAAPARRCEEVTGCRSAPGCSREGTG